MSMEFLKNTGEHDMRRSKTYYQRMFKRYPDLVTVEQFREMLGGIGDTFARRLIRQNKVKHFFIKPFYYIPKSSVIEYLLSDDYAERRLKVWV